MINCPNHSFSTYLACGGGSAWQVAYKSYQRILQMILSLNYGKQKAAKKIKTNILLLWPHSATLCQRCADPKIFESPSVRRF